jgi:NADH-quinone oxidoreductase subunit B
LQGLMLLQDAIRHENRPLSWVLGPDGVEKPSMPSQRDLRTPQRMRMTHLPDPDQV